jgi:hypothetical protein
MPAARRPGASGQDVGVSRVGEDFHLGPQAAIAGNVGRIDPLRDDPFHFQGAGVVVEGSPAPDLVIAEMQRRASTRQQGTKTFFPLRNRHRGDRLAIARWRRSNRKKTRAPLFPVSEAFWIRLNEVVPTDAAQLAVEIGLSRREQRYRCGDGRIFMRPVKPGGGQQPDRAPVQLDHASGSRRI